MLLISINFDSAAFENLSHPSRYSGRHVSLYVIKMELNLVSLAALSLIVFLIWHKIFNPISFPKPALHTSVKLSRIIFNIVSVSSALVEIISRIFIFICDSVHHIYGSFHEVGYTKCDMRVKISKWLQSQVIVISTNIDTWSIENKQLDVCILHHSHYTSPRSQDNTHCFTCNRDTNLPNKILFFS